jgi:hypothetical protein
MPHASSGVRPDELTDARRVNRSDLLDEHTGRVASDVDLGTE